MVVVRKKEAGFTLTEAMVVVVILSLLAALSTPLLRRDNTARKGRDWAKIVAQGLQKARFQAMGDRNNVHVVLYRDHFETHREDPATGTLTLLSSIPGPEPDGDKTVAIWDARIDGMVPGGQNGTLEAHIVFQPLGSTLRNETWRIYIRNELLASPHPDSSFFIRVHGLTGFVSTNDKRNLP
jgi:prepilin-type N-terminal cleavage/methylation domain-containing protein